MPNQTLKWILITTVFGCKFAVAQQGRISAPTFNDQSRNAAIRSVAPAEFKSFEDTAAKSDCVGTAAAAVDLLRQVRSELESQLASEARTNHWRLLRVWSATWQLALRVWQVCDAQEARKTISDEWKEDLAKDDHFVGYQIAPLAAEWDRDFLTKGIWDLLKRSTNATSLRAICFVLYEHGDLGDEKPFLAKRDSGIPESLHGIIQNALNWMTYKHGPKRTQEGKHDPGPAALSPTGPYRWYPYQ